MSAKKTKSKKQAKRSNNDGCIRRRSDGRWEAIYTVRYDSNDQPVRRSVYGKTRGEVTLKLREILQKIAAEEYVPPKRITVGDWMDEWWRMDSIHRSDGQAADVHKHIVEALHV